MKVIVDIASQTLKVFAEEQVIKTFSVSTAKKGVGEIIGSEQTPRGKHIVRAKIGKDAPINSVFIGRRPTGEVYSPILNDLHPNRDWILTRILWLSGKEIGKNRLGNVDTMRRFIYIHGTSDEDSIGIPKSHGCIRMRNLDVIDLFNLLDVGTPVEIV